MAAQVGLDVGSSAIKVVELVSSGEKHQVEAIGMGVNPVGNVVTENKQELEKMAEAVRQTWLDAGIKQKQVRMALNETSVYTRVIEVPPLSEAELASALSWEAEQYIPLPMAEVNLDWQILRHNRTAGEVKKMEVLLVAAPKTAVERMVGVLAQAGLEVEVLETQLTALSRSVSGVTPTLVADLGASGTNIGIVEAGELVLVYHLDVGGMALTRAVSSSLGLDFFQAEQYKRTYGMDERQLEGKIKQALAPTLDQVVVELKKALNFYSSRNRTSRIERLVLSGGGAQLPAITGYLASILNLEVVVGNFLAGMTWPEKIKNRFTGLESVFGVAVGLAVGG